MDSDQARQRLKEEQERLARVRQTIDQEHLGDNIDEAAVHLDVASSGQHQADVGSETFDREKDLSILESVAAELADVEHALRRLDEGTYGKCEACGKSISDDRLAALPASRFCVEDQSMAETEAHLHEQSPQQP